MRISKSVTKMMMTAMLSAVMLGAPVQAEDADPKVTLITNVNVFDGVNEKLIRDANVVVTDNLITKVSTEPLAVASGRVIDGGGRTLMPGLIDAHWHTMFAYLPQAQLLSSNVGFINIAAAQGAGKTLMRGFTTTREAGGGAFGVKQAIDQGMIPGPRIYPSGAPISQTSGHFDFRGPNDVPASPADPLNYLERNNIVMVADGVPEVIKRVR